MDALRVTVSKRRPADGSAGARIGWEARVPVAKVDEGRGLVFGWASTSTDSEGRLLVDHGDDAIPPEDLEAAAYRYTAESRRIGEMHQRIGVGALVESVVITPAKRRAMGLDASEAVGWWIGVRVEDPETRRRAAAGELAEFSIAGEALRRPIGKSGAYALTELVVDEISLVDAGEGLGVQIALRKRRPEVNVEFKLEQLTAMVDALAQSEQDETKRAGIVKRKGEVESALKAPFAKAEVLTLADVQASLPEELWQVVLAAVGNATQAAQAAQSAAPEAETSPGEDDEPKMMDGEDDDDPEKGYDMEKVRKMLDAERAERTKLQKELADLRQASRVEKARALVAEEWGSLPGDRAQLAKARIALDDAVATPGAPVVLDAEAAKGLRETLGRVSKALASSSILDSLGTAEEAEDTKALGTAEAKVLKRARQFGEAFAKASRMAIELRKSNPEMTQDQAVAEVFLQDPDLHAQYRYESERRQAQG